MIVLICFKQVGHRNLAYSVYFKCICKMAAEVQQRNLGFSHNADPKSFLLNCLMCYRYFLKPSCVPSLNLLSLMLEEISRVTKSFEILL